MCSSIGSFNSSPSSNEPPSSSDLIVAKNFLLVMAPDVLGPNVCKYYEFVKKNIAYYSPKERKSLEKKIEQIEKKVFENRKYAKDIVVPEIKKNPFDFINIRKLVQLLNPLFKIKRTEQSETKETKQEMNAAIQGSDLDADFKAIMEIVLNDSIEDRAAFRIEMYKDKSLSQKNKDRLLSLYDLACSPSKTQSELFLLKADLKGIGKKYSEKIYSKIKSQYREGVSYSILHWELFLDAGVEKKPSYELERCLASFDPEKEYNEYDLSAFSAHKEKLKELRAPFVIQDIDKKLVLLDVKIGLYSPNPKVRQEAAALYLNFRSWTGRVSDFDTRAKELLMSHLETVQKIDDERDLVEVKESVTGLVLISKDSPIEKSKIARLIEKFTLKLNFAKGIGTDFFNTLFHFFSDIVESLKMIRTLQ